MPKTTKRAKKFTSKGGIKSALAKGTVTKKGKLKGLSSSGGGNSNKSSEPEEGGRRNPSKEERRKSAYLTQQQRAKEDAVSDRLSAQEHKRQEEDFVGAANLQDLDMESFFNAVADGTVDAADDESDEEEEDREKKTTTERNGDDSDASDSDAEDEDLEAAEERMKKRLEDMETEDPEFHKYLEDNDKSLLEFGNDDDEEVSVNDDDEAMEEEKEEVNGTAEKDSTTKKESNDNGAYVQLTLVTLDKFEQSAFTSFGLKGLKRTVLAYKTACHLSDADGVDGTGNKEYRIDDSVVFDRIMVLALTRCHEAFYYHLLGDGSGHDAATAPANKNKTDDTVMQDDDDDTKITTHDENTPINPRRLAKATKWKDLKKILQTFLKSTHHLLSQVREPKLLTFVLRRLSKYVPYLTPFPAVTKSLLKTLTSHWCAPFQSEDDHVVRLHAFLRIRQLALTQPFPAIEDCLKSLYLAYAKTSKFAHNTESSLPTLTFLGNCLVELYGLDLDSSYQHAFVYIRQLALHLRTALQKKTKESFRVVYCWQYLHCLKLWTAVLGAHCGQGDTGGLRSLVYPLTEIVTGVTRLLPNTRHLPLRLHCVRLLQSLAACTEAFVPTTSLLLEALDCKELYGRPKRPPKRNHNNNTKSGAPPSTFRLPLALKLPKEDTLRTSDQLDPCVNEIFVLLNREVDLYRYSVGFPEFSIRIRQRLRRFNKETKDGRWRAFAKGCIATCERHAACATEARSSLREAPKDLRRLEILKPPGAPTMRERHDASLAKEKGRLAVVTEVAVTPVSKSDVAKARAEAETAVRAVEAGKRKRKRQQKSSSSLVVVNQADLKNVASLGQEDEVQEGIDWSDDEE